MINFQLFAHSGFCAYNLGVIFNLHRKVQKHEDFGILLALYFLASIYFFLASVLDLVELKKLRILRDKFWVVLFPMNTVVVYYALSDEDSEHPLDSYLVCTSSTIVLEWLYVYHRKFSIAADTGLIILLAFFYNVVIKERLSTEEQLDLLFHFYVAYMHGRISTGFLWANTDLYKQLTKSRITDLWAAVVQQDAFKVQSELATLNSKHINQRGAEGRTVLFDAAIRPDSKILSMILKVPGVEVNAEDYAGYTPLYCTVRSVFLNDEEQKQKNIDILIGAGADPSFSGDETKEVNKSKSAKNEAAPGLFSDDEEEGDGPLETANTQKS